MSIIGTVALALMTIIVAGSVTLVYRHRGDPDTYSDTWDRVGQIRRNLRPVAGVLVVVLIMAAVVIILDRSLQATLVTAVLLAEVLGLIWAGGPAIRLYLAQRRAWTLADDEGRIGHRDGSPILWATRAGAQSAAEPGWSAVQFSPASLGTTPNGSHSEEQSS